MKVKDVMTAENLKTCKPHSKLREVAKIMEEGNCGVLPVIDENEKVIGVITDRDICLSLSREHSSSHSHLPVSEIMSANVHTIQEDSDLREALKQMRTKHVSRLPVVDAERKLKGILSMHNLFTKSVLGEEGANHIHGNTGQVLKTVKELSTRYALREHLHEPIIREGELELPFVF